MGCARGTGGNVLLQGGQHLGAAQMLVASGLGGFLAHPEATEVACFFDIVWSALHKDNIRMPGERTIDYHNSMTGTGGKGGSVGIPRCGLGSTALAWK